MFTSLVLQTWCQLRVEHLRLTVSQRMVFRNVTDFVFIVAHNAAKHLDTNCKQLSVMIALWILYSTIYFTGHLLQHVVRIFLVRGQTVLISCIGQSLRWWTDCFVLFSWAVPGCWSWKFSAIDIAETAWTVSVLLGRAVSSTELTFEHEPVHLQGHARTVVCAFDIIIFSPGFKTSSNSWAVPMVE